MEIREEEITAGAASAETDVAVTQPGGGDNWDAPDSHSGEWDVLDTPDDAPRQSAPDETYTIRYLGEEIAITRDELIRLAQKGRDYDRIRTRADSLTERVKDAESRAGILRDIAAREGMTAEQYADRVTAQNIAHEQGIPLEVAERRVRAERARRETALPAEHIAKQARDREAAEFLREYGGEVSPSEIPPEVWDDVRQGKTLLEAYRSFENRELRRKLADVERKSANSYRTTGSRFADGTGPAHGEIEADWFGN